MEFKTIIKTMMMAAACLTTVAFVSCSDDDDDNRTMKFSTSKVEVGIGSTQTVAVAGCTNPLTVKSSDEKTAVVSVDKSAITVKGVAAGTAAITVTDAKKQTGTINATVKEMLTFDKTTLSVSVGKEGTVTVKSGTAPYTVSVKDSKIATATVKDAVVTIKGVKAGTTTVTVTDKNKVTGVVSVTVKK